MFAELWGVEAGSLLSMGVVIEKVSIGRVTRTECASYVAGTRGGRRLEVSFPYGVVIEKVSITGDAHGVR